MTQEEFNTLKPGDKVKIVDKWVGSNHNRDGLMDKWLGKTMTIREILRTDLKMVEDKYESFGGWIWDREMIECKEDKMRVVDERGFTVDEEYFKEEEIK